MQNKFLNSVTKTTSLSLALGLSACSNSAPIANIPRLPEATLVRSIQNTAQNEQLQALLRVDDTISVTVAREPGLSLASVRIADDGTVDVPYIGQMAAAGRAPREFAAEIQARLGKDYLSDPRVSVNIIEYASHTVVVEGAVGHPGQLTYNKGTTLLGAIASSGGPTRVAKLNQVAIFRVSTGERQVAVFDLNQVRSGKQSDPLLEPGDQVIVGFSGMRQAWQDLLQAVPLFAIFYRL